MCGSLTINKGPQEGLATSHSGKQYGYSLPTRVHRLKTKSAAQHRSCPGRSTGWQKSSHITPLKNQHSSLPTWLKALLQATTCPTRVLCSLTWSVLFHRPFLTVQPSSCPLVVLWFSFTLLLPCIARTRTRVNPFSLSSTLAHQPLPSFLPLITYVLMLLIDLGQRSYILLIINLALLSCKMRTVLPA